MQDPLSRLYEAGHFQMWVDNFLMKYSHRVGFASFSEEEDTKHHRAFKDTFRGCESRWTIRGWWPEAVVAGVGASHGESSTRNRLRERNVELIDPLSTHVYTAYPLDEKNYAHLVGSSGKGAKR